MTKAEIDHRVRTGALWVEYPGIYRVGHRAPSVEASYLAAVWACGEGARLGGQAAAYHWVILKGKPPRPEVIAPKWRRVKGVKTSQRKLTPADGTIHRGVPITSVPRTLVDLAADLSLSDLARACHEAGVKYGPHTDKWSRSSTASPTPRAPPTSERSSTATSASP